MKKWLFFIAIVLTPHIAQAAVKITEIAWMGTSQSQYAEWIELYNDSEEAVSLANWKLYEEGGATPIFTFSKSINPKSYLLLERVTASSPDPVPGIDDESGTFGGSGLSNSGEHLVLKDEGGAIVEDLDYSSGWPAGDVDTKETMQLNDTSWITAQATPDAPSAGNSVDESTQTTMTTNATDTSAPRSNPHIEFVFPQVVYSGIEYTFNATVVLEYMSPSTGTFVWNMGDGTYIKTHTNEPMVHAYAYPGTYTVSFAYYGTDAYVPTPLLQGTKVLSVITPSITLSLIDNQAIRIENNSSTPVDLSGWKINTGLEFITVPDMTIIAPKAVLVIPEKNIGIAAPIMHVALETPSGATIAQTLDNDTAHPRTSHTIVKDYSTYTIPESIVEARTSTLPAPEISTARKTEGFGNEQRRTKEWIYGAALVLIIGLFILLERFMASREY